LADVVKAALDAYNSAINKIADYAETGVTAPTTTDYAAAGVTGVTNANLAAVNDAINSQTGSDSTLGNADDRAGADTAAEVQAIVNAYNAILAEANDTNSTAGDTTADATPASDPTAAQYATIGADIGTAATDAENLALLNDIVGASQTTDVDTIAEINNLARIANAIQQTAAGQTPSPALTAADLEKVGLVNVTPDNLAAVLNAIAAKADDGSATDSLSELQGVIDSAVTAYTNALNAIKEAAQSNNASDTSPTAQQYVDAGVTGVTAENLAAINSALNSVPVTAEKADTTAEVQAIVDAYKAILAEANDTNSTAGDTTADATPASDPTAAQYATIGADIGTAATDAENLALLNDIVGASQATDVDTIAEINNLARIANAIQQTAAGQTPNPALTPADLAKVGLSGVTADNLTAVLNAIAAQADNGSATDSLPELQAVINTAATAYANALDAISAAAEGNSATTTSPSAQQYADAGVSGVTSANLAAINDALNSAPVNGAAADTAAEVQAIVNAYNKILSAADGTDSNATATPTADDYAAIGVTGVDAATAALLSDVIDGKPTDAVDTVAEVQALADAARAVLGYDDPATDTAPTKDQINALVSGQTTGSTTLNNPVTDDALKAVQQAIDAANSDGTPIASQQELADVVKAALDAYNSAINKIADYAETGVTAPTTTDYAAAGVTGVTNANLAAVNDAINSQTGSDSTLGNADDRAGADTAAEVQAIVNAYNAILAEANDTNSTAGDTTADATPASDPTAAQYATIGADIGTAATDAENLALLNDIVGASQATDVDTIAEINNLARIANAIQQTAAGQTPNPALTAADLEKVGLVNVTPDNLAAVLNAIAAKADDGSATDSLSELQAIVDAATGSFTAALSAIRDAAQGNTATGSTPSLAQYNAIGVTGVNANNLSSISDALNSAAVDGAKADTAAEVQAIVDAYNAILAEANGTSGDASAQDPTAAQYAAIGVTGVDAGPETSLLGDVIGTKTTDQVDTVAEVQALANAVASTVAWTGTQDQTAPTVTELGLLATGVTADNLAAVNAAIAAANADGAPIATQAELQSLIDNAVAAYTNALNAISAAAEGNTANATSPTAQQYADAGVSGVNSANLSAINSALNSSPVNGSAANTAAEVQAIVDAYKAILAEANDTNSTAGDTTADATPASDPTAAQYATIGADIGTAATDAENLALLNDIVGASQTTDVDTIAEINELARIANAIQQTAAGQTPNPALTPADLAKVGLSGVTADNLTAVLNAIAAQVDNGSATDSLPELQAVINTAATAYANALDAISAAAEGNSATTTSPSAQQYADAGVSGVTSANLAAINDALNSAPVNGAAADTAAEVQAIVNAYNKILSAADGTDSNATATPTAGDYTAIGVTGVDAATAALLSDVIDGKPTDAVDTVAEVQALADAARAVLGYDDPTTDTAPTKDQINALVSGQTTGGSTLNNPVTDDALKAVQQAIDAANSDGSPIASQAELASVVNNALQAYQSALNAISAAAEADSASSTTPTTSQYADAGVTGVDSSNVAAINSSLNTAPVNGDAVDTAAEIQPIVNAWNDILAEANDQDGSAGDSVGDVTPNSDPTAVQYAAIGATIGTAATDTENLALLNDIVGAAQKTDVDSVAEINELARIANAIQQLVAGGSPSPALIPADFTKVGLTHVNADNINTVLAALTAQNDSGAATDSLAELLNIIDAATANFDSALADIKAAADSNNATNSSPSQAIYNALGITGVTADNLSAINSALNSTPVTGAEVNSAAEVQAIVNAYNKILSAADGTDSNATATPTAGDYTAIGVTGV
ncbi:beta strand repeat-containing protein, partial [Flavobacterium sp.]|uniref:beta strand repeat-containing protein n=1 Tax=Flavobacterium sp. TaxID=239 RepID=UPI0037BFB67E